MDTLHAALRQRFPGVPFELSGYGTPEATGWLEVTVAGSLVHSKKRGDGYIDRYAAVVVVVGAVVGESRGRECARGGREWKLMCG